MPAAQVVYINRQHRLLPTTLLLLLPPLLELVLVVILEVEEVLQDVKADDRTPSSLSLLPLHTLPNLPQTDR